jgi:hypothetical protein
MNQPDARQRGIERGIEAATHCLVDDLDRRHAGCDCKHPAVCEECLTEAAFDAEANSRQYTPFEFFAQAMNEVEPRAEGLWQAYERGVGTGIVRGSRKRLGLEPLPEMKS